MTENIQDFLRKLPKIDELLPLLPFNHPYSIRLKAARQAISEAREAILQTDLSHLPEATERLANKTSILRRIEDIIRELERPSLRPVVNATGVVIHTNLGRSPLPRFVLEAMCRIAEGYSNLEYDLMAGKRGSRYSHVEAILCELLGVEAALVVNNNAAAVLITLDTLAKGKEVIVSRGELVEIGGAFRIPDVMARSGAILREVGTTNRTHLADYQNAISSETALLMKVHQSNFYIGGFTKAVDLQDLAGLAKSHGIPLYEDLGSGTFVDFSRFGMHYEPTVQDSIQKGADLVSFSGDKLLGGPQAGVIVGRGDLVNRIKKNPLNRALRIDKLTLAGLEAVLMCYRDVDKAVELLPTLSMLTASPEQLKKRAVTLCNLLKRLGLSNLLPRIVTTEARVGGGAIPAERLQSYAVAIDPAQLQISAARMEELLRNNEYPILVRVEKDLILLDVRTLQPKDLRVVAEALRNIMEAAHE
ncbi:MAG: L-seryl-tRNA(Sec) selenium transferase [Deltaproteobacteria bacterium]|jgi:L-seryl-tRNA(Ser) seleniumtransferase|nr:L-seryl-tRNA(Sec) selenium transferase [Deltaproteobacteria bacterium]